MRRIAEIALWAVFFVMIFVAGWWRGRYPEWSLRTWLWPADKIHLLVSETRWLPTEFVGLLQQESGKEFIFEDFSDLAEIEARVIPSPAPHLLWIPEEWVRHLDQQGLLLDLAPLRDLIEKKIHPDFRHAEGRLASIPLLWAWSEGRLRLMSLAIPQNTPDSRLSLRLAREWLRPDLALTHVRSADAATTLRALEKEDLRPEKKASALREQQLKTSKPNP